MLWNESGKPIQQATSFGREEKLRRLFLLMFINEFSFLHVKANSRKICEELSFPFLWEER